MGLYISGKDDKRSELQSKIIADLQEKARSTSLQEGGMKYEDSKLLEDQHQTRTAGIVIGILIIALAVTVVFVIVGSNK